MTDNDPFAQCLPKYQVHPESYEYVKRIQELGQPYWELSPEEARLKKSLDKESVQFEGKETEIIIPSPHSEQGIAVTVYKPDSCPGVPAIVIYFHGGGHVLGSRESLSGCLKTISQKSGAIFINVEYRLLPNPDSPIASFEDGLVVSRWVLSNKMAVGGQAKSKVGIGGDSAGGHIAAGVTNDVLDLDFQVLVYPMTDVTRSQPSFKEFTTTPGLTLGALNWFSKYSTDLIPGAATNPVVNPMVRTNTSQTPPACFVLAELDALRDCGLAYADKLRAAGVSVECHMIKGVPHAFFGYPDIFKTKCVEAFTHIIGFIKKFNQ